MIKCPHCGKFLKTTSGLRRHITLVHKNNGSEEVFSDKDRRLLYHIKDVLEGHIKQEVRLPKKQSNQDCDPQYKECLSELKDLFQRFENE